jgi:excisionase family DNA binding protein
VTNSNRTAIPDGAAFLTLDQVSNLLQLSRTTLVKLAAEGTLQFVRVGSCIRYRKADVDRFIATAVTGA